MKEAGMLVVSLMSVNFRFWSRLGCSGQNTIIFSCKGPVSFGIAHEEILKSHVFFNSFYLLDSCNQSLSDRF